MRSTSSGPARRQMPASPAGAIADVAFLLLIFFLVTTQIPEEKGITTQLPPYELLPPAPIPERNVLSVLINAEGRILADGRPAQLDELGVLIRTFVLNPEGASHLASAPARAVVSLQHDRSTRYDDYLAVYDRMLAAYRSMWEEEAVMRYGTSYQGLPAERKKAIRKAVPLVISEAEPSDALQ